MTLYQKIKLEIIGYPVNFKFPLLHDLAQAFDPFVGVCTVPLAARKLDRQFIGIDLKPEYLDMGIKRLYLAERNISRASDKEYKEILKQGEIFK